MDPSRHTPSIFHHPFMLPWPMIFGCYYYSGTYTVYALTRGVSEWWIVAVSTTNNPAIADEVEKSVSGLFSLAGSPPLAVSNPPFISSSIFIITLCNSGLLFCFVFLRIVPAMFSAFQERNVYAS